MWEKKKQTEFTRREKIAEKKIRRGKKWSFIVTTWGMQGRAWRGVDRLGVRVPEEVINWSTDDTDRCPFDVLVVHVQDSRLNCHESYKRRVLGGNRWSSSCWTLPPSVSALVRCFLIFHSLSCEHCGGWKKRLLCQNWSRSINSSWICSLLEISDLEFISSNWIISMWGT